MINVMNKPSLAIMQFTGGNGSRREGYEALKKYAMAAMAGQKTIISKNGQPVEIEGVAENFALPFIKSELTLLSGIDINNYQGNIENYSNMSSVIEAFYAIITTVLKSTVPASFEKYVGQLAQVISVDAGDTLEIKVPAQNMFISTAIGTSDRHHEAQRGIPAVSATIIPKWYGLTVYADLYNILTGKEDLATYVRQANTSLMRLFQGLVYNDFQKAMNELELAAPNDLFVDGLTQDDALRLAETIAAWTGNAAFYGSPSALSKLLPTNTSFMHALGDEYVKMGYISEYMGYPVIGINPVADIGNKYKIIDNSNYIYVMSPSDDKIVKAAVSSFDWNNTDNANDGANHQVKATLRAQFGTGILTNALVGLIKIS